MPDSPHSRQRPAPLENDPGSSTPWPVEPEDAPRPVIEIKARETPPPAPPRPPAAAPPPAAPPPAVSASPVTGKAVPAPSPEDEKTAQERQWLRKAKDRRLKANAPAVKEEEAEYAPGFTPQRFHDWTPEFDQAPGTTPEGVPVAVQRTILNYRWSWLLAAGGALALLLIFSIVFLLLKRDDFEDRRRDAVTASTNSPDMAKENAIRSTVEMVPEVKKAVERFYAAKTVEEKLPFVRGGAAMAPAMKAYYALHPIEPPEALLFANVGFLNIGAREFVTVTGKNADTFFEVSVERTASGPRLDWRELTGCGEMDWKEWQTERPARPVRLRVVSARDDFYSGIFTDQEKWLCLKITDITRSSTVWAYAERRSTAGYGLARFLRNRFMTAKIQGTFEFPPPESRGTNTMSLTPQVYLRTLDDNGWVDTTPEATATTVTPGQAEPPK